MKIGFIKATNEIDVQWFKPLAFGYLKAYLEQNLKVPFSMDLVETPEELAGYDIAAISATSQDYARAIEIARGVKRANGSIVTLLGGHHITSLPETLTEDFDIGVLGEGEQTLLELMEYFHRNGQAAAPEELKAVNGIIFRDKGGLVRTGKREPVPTEQLPHPSRDCGTAQYVFTSRGCPYKCSFCSSAAFWGRARFFSAEYVVEEIEQLLERNPGMKQVPIWDDLFMADKKRLARVVELIEAKGLNKKTTFSFSVRANQVDAEMCRAMKQLNVVGVAFGAESGSDRILGLMNKGATVAQNQAALDLLKSFGIPVMCSFIVGWPTETEAEVRQTFDFIRRNVTGGKLPSSNAVNILMPIPGTPLWDEAVRDGLIDPAGLDWNRLSTFASYRDSTLGSFAEWTAHRRAANSLYLNEAALPQERLYELMAGYYRDMELLEKHEPGQRDHLAFSGPETVNLELTLRCNLKCGMCQRSSGDFKLPAVTDMPVALVERALPLMTDANYVWLSGFGEPLMHPELVTIIKKVRAVNKKAEIAFTTNFVLMTGQKLADIVSSGLSLIQVSMDGDNELGHSFAPTPEGVARYQDRLWKNLRAFHAEKLRQGGAGPKLQFCFVGMKRNIAQLEGIIKQGLEVGLSSIVVQPVRDYNGTMAGEDLFENRAYALPILDRARDYARQSGVEFICRFMSENLTVARQQCAFPKVFLHVAVNGHVYMCCEGIAADQNIGVTDPVAIWNSAPYRQLRRELATGKMRKKCWDCPLVKPAAAGKDAVKKGLLELTPGELAGEVLTHRSYVDGCHEREEALARKCAALEGAQGKHEKLLLAYKDVIQNINRTETALSPLALAARSRRRSGSLHRDCLPFLDTIPPLLTSLRSSQESFPGLRGPAKDLLSSAQNMGEILEPLALCGDLGTANRIISGQLVPALDGFSGLFRECRNELNLSLEATAKSL